MQKTLALRNSLSPVVRRTFKRPSSLVTLAIESSCDDTSVAVLEKFHKIDKKISPPGARRAKLHYHETVTSDHRDLQGISPIRALEKHQGSLALLVQDALRNSERWGIPRPDFISVTRGPGMRSNLFTGLDTAKGLAVAFGIPLIGVNHMQAHALTPRLVSALRVKDVKPAYPFLSLLVSGGHTMLLHSKDVLQHHITADTLDSALGNELDQIARDVLPDEVLQSCGNVAYARALEEFVFEPIAGDSSSAHVASVYEAPSTKAEEITPRIPNEIWGWSLPIPLAEHRAAHHAKSAHFSFSGLGSSVKTIVKERRDKLTLEERKSLGYEAMRIGFEHLANRVVLALDALPGNSEYDRAYYTLVISGGVASNKFLRVVLRNFLDARGYAGVKLLFPPLEFCTDNAAMIAWAGMEMYEAGWKSDLSIRALRKWSMDPGASDGGILGVGGWARLEGGVIAPALVSQEPAIAEKLLARTEETPERTEETLARTETPERMGETPASGTKGLSIRRVLTADPLTIASDKAEGRDQTDLTLKHQDRFPKQEQAPERLCRVHSGRSVSSSAPASAEHESVINHESLPDLEPAMSRKDETLRELPPKEVNFRMTREESLARSRRNATPIEQLEPMKRTFSSHSRRIATMKKRLQMMSAAGATEEALKLDRKLATEDKLLLGEEWEESLARSQRNKTPVEQLETMPKVYVRKEKPETTKEMPATVKEAPAWF